MPGEENLSGECMLGISHVVVHSVSRWQSLMGKAGVGWVQKSMEERLEAVHISKS